MNSDNRTVFETKTCKGEIIIANDQSSVTVRGQISDNVRNATIHYLASAPMDRRASFSGSGLPFANATQAFFKTPNQGSVQLKMNNMFEIEMSMPNSYYVGLGTVLVPPSLFLSYDNGIGMTKIKIQVAKSVPYRMLTYPMATSYSRSGAGFYNGGFKLPVRTQEQILLDSAYPMEEHADFWGLKPRQ